MKKLLTILLVLISFSGFAQFEAGEFVNTDTVKIDGVPLLLNTFKEGNLGSAGNIFYSTGASSQPESGSLNQVIGGNTLTTNFVPKWDGSKFANSSISDIGYATGVGVTNPVGKFQVNGDIIITNSNFALGVSGSFWQLDHVNSTSNSNARLRAFQDGGYAFANIELGGSGYVIVNSRLGVNTLTPSEIVDVNGNVIADVLKSRVPTGTPPLVVASSTVVDSLNAGLLDGKKASDFQLKSDTLTFDATISDLNDSTAAIRALANTKAVVSGTDNYIMKKTGTNTLGNSSLIDYGSYMNSSVQFNAPIFYAGSTAYSAGYVDLGFGRTGNNFAFIDLIGDQTYTDYGLRIIRGNAGANSISQLTHRGKGVFSIRTQDAGDLDFYTKNTFVAKFDTLQNAGFGTLTPAARIHSQSTGTQLRLGYDATKYTDLSTGSTGNLTIDPTGDTVKVVGAVNSTGGFSTTSKSNLNDVVGDSAVFANMKMTYGAGLNKIIYSDATGNFIWGNQSSTLLAIAGVTPSTGYLYYNGSTFSYTSGGSAQWTADTYGIKYTSGKVGIGSGSDSDNLLTVGDGSTNTNIAIKAISLNKRAISAVSGSNTAIEGQGGLDGVYGVGTRYGVQGASPNGNGVRGSSTNAAGVYGTSTYGYGGEFSGLGINISAGGLSIGGTTRISSTGTFTPSNGVSGSFTSADGKTITVTNGIITGIN